ncbi:hypothetical protein AX774_g6996 [Zancudomyces culisetae]|uniref:Uncharacterized protein n=1 Tax=Zancudomyces culisetae TaxID=1213189 RepID=A0A1R1PF38_ZANCU|nr:hypothetical protein AX774_g6996 [Zancudomyces culisetae]|eukprot:OMH79581.1 hypothetical protein AX774_g6996 [Zancudomyces culisetae]
MYVRASAGIESTRSEKYFAEVHDSLYSQYHITVLTPKPCLQQESLAGFLCFRFDFEKCNRKEIPVIYWYV